MKNLYRLSHETVKSATEDLTSAVAFVVDLNTSDALYVATGQGLWRLSRDGTCVCLLPVENVIALEHLSLSEEICLAKSDGDIVTYNLGTAVDESVSFCANGLAAMCWSPEQEVVVFVDGAHSVVTMNSGYDPISEVSLLDDTFGDREFMSVGWGKKETQFHGSEGKGAARKTKQEAETQLDVSAMDGRVHISWRADGDYFVVGFLSVFGRAFKIFSKEGALQFTSEKWHGLESELAWRPSGLWIATPHVMKDKYTIGLFEKNGLRHREIDLPFQREQEQVLSLHWSPDSEVLAVHSYSNERTVWCVRLYVIGNYHWYVKQYFEYATKVVGLRWDQRFAAGKTLHVLLQDGRHEISRWEFTVSHSTGLDRKDESLVAVIDNTSVLLTNFRGMMVPPPMCGHRLESERSVNIVGFLRYPDETLDGNAFFTITSDLQICVYRPTLSEGTTKRLTGTEIIGKMQLENDTDMLSHWLWLSNDHLLASVDGASVRVFKISLDSPLVTTVTTLSLGTEKIGCIESYDKNSALVETLSGQTHLLTYGDSGEWQLSEHLQLPEFCEQVRVRNGNVYGLTNRRVLYHNTTVLASDVTSFFLSVDYLLITTISSLKFVHLKQGTIVGERRLERGSKLITVVPRASRTVMQLPRGNLEAINPRVLSLCLIADHLDALEYHEAFDILRKERINLNIIVDHEPARFLAHLDRFLAQITNVNWLNLFITDLENQDVCRSMYGSNYQGHAPALPEQYSVDCKVSFVCERLLQTMDRSPFVLTLPKVTCYVKQGQLQQALALIWTLKRETPDAPEAAEEALRYLLYLVEVNDLYDVALGMYDFGLVLFVATKSQKDPKEYLPFLNELKRLDENYRKFRIDCHLKRFAQALEHIALCDDADGGKFEEALALTVKHGLYMKAIESYRNNDGYQRRIYALYGDFLRQGGRQADASLMYERAANYQQAVASARHAMDWRRCLRLAALGGFDAEETKRIVQSLIPALAEHGEYDSAAMLAKHHLKETKHAIELLLKGNLYDKALLIAAKDEDRAMLEAMIRASVEEYLGQFLNLLEHEKEEFLRHKNRLLLVREEKAKRRLEPADDDDDARDVDDCDLYSDVSTIASSRYTGSSGRTGKTHRSSKNRRKHQRKLLSLKEGNPFEDIALIDALHAAILRVCDIEQQRRVRQLCQVALELEYDDAAREVQRNYDALFNLMRSSLDAIWIPEMIVSGTGGDASAMALQTGNLGQMQDAQHYAMINPHQRYKPDLPTILWQWDILK